MAMNKTSATEAVARKPMNHKTDVTSQRCQDFEDGVLALVPGEEACVDVIRAIVRTTPNHKSSSSGACRQLRSTFKRARHLALLTRVADLIQVMRDMSCAITSAFSNSLDRKR